MAKVKAQKIATAVQVMTALHHRLETEICQALMVENTRLAERLNRHLVDSKKAMSALQGAS